MRAGDSGNVGSGWVSAAVASSSMTVVVHEERTAMIIIMVRSVLNVNNKKQHLVTLVHLQ